MGNYSEYFGSPEFEVKLQDSIIIDIKVLRGAPCGATWEVAQELVGLEAEEAITKIGLRTQFNCTADPAAWDPIGGKSPVHFAGEIHSRALKKAILQAEQAES